MYLSDTYLGDLFMLALLIAIGGGLWLSALAAMKLIGMAATIVRESRAARARRWWL